MWYQGPMWLARRLALLLALVPAAGGAEEDPPCPKPDALVALASWHPWISPIGAALGGLFVVTGIASFRDLRARRPR